VTSSSADASLSQEEVLVKEENILPNEESVTVVDLGDGQKANIILPEELLHANSPTN